VSWTPNKSLVGKKVTATTTWDLGPFGKLTAKKTFTVQKPVKPPKRPTYRPMPGEVMVK
jgi:hypothetical protein